MISLLLTEFSVRTVNYGPSFFPLICGPRAKRAGHKSLAVWANWKQVQGARCDSHLRSIKKRFLLAYENNSTLQRLSMNVKSDMQMRHVESVYFVYQN